MNKKKILLADDEEDILNLLKKKLIENDFDCITTPRGTDVLTLAKASRPDLMLLDIAMPDMDGYNVASELRKEKSTRDIPIIFLTGKELEPRAISERVENLGAYDFLMKPCSMKDLLEKIKSVLGSL